ncbi:SDR family NAD(P)-dependent oxidoreductase [Stigmatella aurantiaca]|uniref:Short-chain dehydrogenase n=1 Tax=Stigmatella aurantiaca (strain DW4/3-1) TaxID=378806 RepID=Q097Q1_STIAD|nr:SDR family oxidoreductase [Stigmatella aurantiaca]ADO75788.1 Short-chain dehydrogenase [Stigmatella aurantiaca DW4/3-1]EAU67950.1 short-chain dehydrogenase [Stigmatella aurantiaca DW4/3-1]
MSRKVALVTGASAGLGEQFAQRFAQDGHDLILVARTTSRLETLAARLEQAHGIKAHVLTADLSRPEAPERLFEDVRARGLTVEYLVNNAGFGSAGPFLEQPLEREAEMVEVNCTSLLKLTHLFARTMRERGSGRILNIASTAGFQPGPYMATYYATKAFVLSFSEALAHELKGTGVTVTCYCPGATHTEFAARAQVEKSRLFQRPGVATAPDVAADGYAAMMKGRVLSIHGLLNWIGTMGVRFGPRALVRSIAASLNQS